MAEAIDRPAGRGGEVTPAPAAPGDGIVPGEAGPHLPPAPPPAAPEAYRPLSLLALAGFVLSVLYSGLIGIAGAVALAGRSPLLLPLWLVFLPLALGAVCWVARNRVRDSEGTLGGGSLASWGLGLSLVFGLVYGSYYAATYFAVRQQATAAADTWLDLLKKGEVERAFRLTVPPPQRPADDANLRAVLEVAFNAEKAQATLNWFRQCEFVHLFQRGEVETQPVGMVEWDYEKGAYHVQLRYHLRTPEVSGDAIVTMVGAEAQAGEFEGRQWQIIAPQSNYLLPLKATPEGERKLKATESAREFADAWLRHVMFQEWEKAWQETLPPAEREAATQVAGECRAYSFTGVAGGALLGAADDRHRDGAVSAQYFAEGGLVRSDPKVFWASPKQRSEIEQTARAIFYPGPLHRVARLTMHQARMSAWREVSTAGGPRVLIPFDVQAMVMQPDLSTPQYGVEARVIIEGDPQEFTSGSPGWRVHSLELVSGRTASADEGPGGMRRTRMRP
jgi:hypothetical protein